MDYRGPQSADYDNVRALNRAFLEMLGDRAGGRRLLAVLSPALAERCRSLRRAERERLAGAPFLLLAFRERDIDWWERLFESGRSRELFAVHDTRPASEAALLSAALGFVWQLARLNPYAARLICAASLHWCEQLAERPLFDILARAAEHDVLELRAGDDEALWSKLLHAGTSADSTLCRAARISALQRLLTGANAELPAGSALAARRLATPARRLGARDER